jgi:hypothetical protein
MLQKKHKRSIFSTGLSVIKLQEILVIFKAVITAITILIVGLDKSTPM